MSESKKPPTNAPASVVTESQPKDESNRITFLDELLIQHLPKRFNVLRVLGKGAFGVVFLVRDSQFQRDVAVKILRPEWMSNPSTKNRFLRESRAAARLNHSAIVRVLEADENQAIAWQVCDAIEGVSLAHYLKNHSLCAMNSAALVAKLADAVECAHRAGVVHRDIKPENVLLRMNPSGVFDCEEVFLTDFGLAKILDEDVMQSRSGAVVGTPRYMAPEQFRDGDARSQPSVDVYSLGIMLFECLTGHSPFEGSDTLTQRLAQSTVLHPSPRQWLPSLPIDLVTICQKAMNPNPPLRYASAGELASDLNSFVQGNPITARPLNLIEKSHRFAKQNIFFVVVTGAILACMSAVLLVSLRSKNEIAKKNIRLAEVNNELANAKSVAEQHADNSEQLRVQSIEEKQRFQDLAWSSGIREAYRNWEESNLWEAKNSLKRLQQGHHDAAKKLEWQLLDTEIDSQFAELLRLDSSIEELRTIPKSSSVAAVSSNGKLYILDSSTGNVKTELHSGVKSLHALDVHPDQSYLLLGGTTDAVTDHASLLKFDLQSNELTVATSGFSTTLESICFNRTGNQVLCASRYQDVRLYNCKSMEFEAYPSDRRHAWLSQTSQSDAFVYQQDHFTIGLPGQNPEIGLTRILTQNKALGPIQYATVVSNLDFIAIATEDETDILLFSSQSNNIVARLTGRRKSKVRSMVKSQDGSCVLIGNESGEIISWDLSELLNQPETTWSSPIATAQTISPNGQWYISNNPIITLATLGNQLFCGTQSGNLIRLLLPIGKSTEGTGHSSTSERSRSFIAALGSDANSIALRGADGTVYSVTPTNRSHTVENAAQGQLDSTPSTYPKRIADLPLHNLLDSAIELSGKSPYFSIAKGIATNKSDRLAWLQSQQELCVLENGMVSRFNIQIGEHSELLVIGVSPTGQTVALRGDLYAVFLVNLDKIEDAPASFKLNGLAGSIAWHPDGNKILIGGDFNELYEYELLTGIVRKVVALPSTTNQVEYIEDGTKAVSAHHDGTIRISNLNTGQIQSISSHRSEIRSMSIPKDRRVGLSIDRENNLALWAIPTMERIGTLVRGTSHEQNFSQVAPCVAIDRDGRKILLVHNSGGKPVLRYWELGK